MLVILVLIPILAYVGLCALAYFMQNSIIFPRTYAGPSTVDAPAVPESEVWWIDIGDGQRVEAWWMPAPPDAFPGPRPTVVFFHGNAELIEHNLDLARMYLNLGINVAFLEYPGYGRSTGTPSQAAIVRSADALLEKVTSRPEVDTTRIILHGRSLGGGGAGALIGRADPAAVILESTFTSMAAMVERYYLPGFLCTSPFRTDRALALYDGPTLLMHGENDTIVPCENSRALAKIAKHATLITNDRDHNDFGTDVRWYAAQISGFLRANGIITNPE